MYIKKENKKNKEIDIKILNKYKSRKLYKCIYACCSLADRIFESYTYTRCSFV